MSKQTEKSKSGEGIQNLHSPKHEPISQGQPFDEQQRQEKNPDGSQKNDKDKEDAA
ncbi:MAG TPA: hypothetical protein VFA74_03585 [Terriglobales bacterium]|nr:hypothetical protein [Terriglobales bacterium]